MKKILFLVGFLCISFSLIAQNDNSPVGDDNSVALSVIGQGKTIDEARAKALRSAIEQAFGTFISSNTSILNDDLIKDEVVSVSNGNIQKYDVIDEKILPDGSYITTLKAVVSINKLTSFCASKGINSEFKGGLFAMNIALQELNEKNERIAWINTLEIISNLLPKCVDYRIEVGEPKADGELWEIPVGTGFWYNKNWDIITSQLYQFVKSVSMDINNVNAYKKLNKKVYPISFNNSKDQSIYYLRTQYVRDAVLFIPWRLFKFCVTRLEIDNGIEKYNLFSIANKNEEIQIQDWNKGYIDFKNSSLRFSFFCQSKTCSVENNIGDLISVKGEKGILRINNYLFGYLRSSSINDNTLQYLIPEYIIEKNPDLIPMSLIFDLKNFINIAFIERRNLNELKNISEYKISLNLKNYESKADDPIKTNELVSPTKASSIKGTKKP